MDGILAALALQQGGAFSTADATRCGLDANELAALVRADQVVRVCPRGYVDAEILAAADTPEARQALLVNAVVRSFDGRMVASHHSAAALHGLPLWDVKADLLHVCCRAGIASRARRGLRIHESYPADGVTAVDGLPAVTAALAVIGTAMVDGEHAGVAAADKALHDGLTTVRELEEWLARLRRRPHLGRARRAVALAEPLTESVGETRTRLILRSMPDLPPVRAQHPVRDADGTPWARVDFLVGDWLVVEFDGAVKYRVDQAQSADEAAAILAQEKRREDRLRDLGYVVVRLVWSELADPLWVARKVRQGLQRVDTPPGGRR